MSRALQSDLVATAVDYADRWLEYQLRTRRCPGVTAAVRLGGELLLSTAHGLADIDSATPMRPDHVFRIASHSKTVTATLVAQLVEQEVLRYDDRVVQHLPWLGDDAKTLGRTTLRDLLSHSTGVYRDGEAGDFWQFDGDFPDEPTLRAMATDRAQVLPANQQFKYSNVGFALLGQVLEVVTGSSYADLVRERIARPLGLPGLVAELTGEVGPMATGYTSRRFGMSRVALPHTTTGAYVAATGCCATAENLALFAEAHCFGVPGLLSDDAKRVMQQPLWAVEGEKQHYALGLQCFDVGPRSVLGHGGAFPGFITATRFDPSESLVVVVLTNAIDGPAAELANGIVRLIDSAHDGDGPAAEPDADRFAGRFYSVWGVTDIVRIGRRLVAVDLDRIDPSDHQTVLRPISDDELEIVSTSGLRNPGEQVCYDFADDGSVRSIRFGAQTLLPLDAFRETPYAGRPES
ncbi:MAG TPA: serine hydrolase domain-containing protein [Mycobacteriales bacterium]|nr:serine hydrolase domain-containing protein [Mycobacteriales bacterium]